MAYKGYIDKFKKGDDEYNIKAASANTAIVAENAELAERANFIGPNVEKYSGVYGGKQREGLQIHNGVNEAVIELNDKGNFSVESLTKHLNLESAQGVQIKPKTTIIFDSSRRIENNKGNEINVEAKFDDYKDRTNPEYSGKDGSDKEWAELKIKSRNLDLRCNDHGGIALQIAGKDKNEFENKIKFESDRITPITEAGSYNGEGGKGLEFGTFNNLHTSLYTGDYRFKGSASVYGVTREEPTLTETGKKDYPTQPDDFKDVLDENNKATWNEIISAANKCKGKEAIASENYVNAQIAQAQIPEGEVDLSAYATTEYVDNAVASSGGGAALIPGNGITISEGRISVNNYSNIEPLTALTGNVDALDYIKIGNKKGNFAVDVKGKYTWELTGPKLATTVDEYGVEHAKGDRVVNYSDESFYLDEDKFYYKAEVEAIIPNGNTVPEGTIVYNAECNLTFDENCGYQHIEMADSDASFYEDETKYVFKGTKNISIKYGQTTPIKKKEVLSPSDLSQEEIEYYEGQTPVYDEETGNLISGWEKIPVWKKSTLWTMNEININLETDSKIKFDGKKIETCWGEDENENPIKMAEILLSTESLAADATEVLFEQKISKNGDRSGQDTEIVYSFGNNVADPEKVADFDAFKANYNGKHTPKTDEELQAMYDAFLAEGESFEISVKVSELLGLVAKVAELESRIEALENHNNE